jgi:excisionase family DNA binding protein
VNPLRLICSTAEAAAILGVSRERVVQFARAGRIEGRKMDRDWVLVRASVKAFAKVPRKPGPMTDSA